MSRKFWQDRKYNITLGKNLIQLLIHAGMNLKERLYDQESLDKYFYCPRELLYLLWSFNYCTCIYFSRIHILAELALNQVLKFMNMLIFVTTMHCNKESSRCANSWLHLLLVLGPYFHPFPLKFGCANSRENDKLPFQIFTHPLPPTTFEGGAYCFALLVGRYVGLQLLVQYISRLQTWYTDSLLLCRSVGQGHFWLCCRWCVCVWGISFIHTHRVRIVSIF